MTPAEGIEYLQRMQARDPKMPVFVLIAPDAYAPATVRAWAAMCLQRYNDPRQDDAHAPTRVKGQRASELADEMRCWQASHGCKAPD